VRKSNIELLRIFSMLLIVMHHYSVHGGFNLYSNNIVTINKIIIQFLSAGGKLGVDCFILITGYFMINSSISAKKVFKLLFEISFYSVTIYILFNIFGYINFDMKAAIKSFFPTIFGMYWFATNYVVLYLLSPFLNQLLKNLNRENHFKLIFLLVIIWSILPTFTTASPAYSPLGWFITLYIIAAFIRLYLNNYLASFKINILLFMFGYLCVLLSIVIFDFIGQWNNVFAKHATFFTGMNKLTVLFCSVTLFLAFKNLKIKNNKVINSIAATMFGVYLIHDNRYLRPFLWQDLFHNNTYYESSYLLIHAVIVILFVFWICTIIDMIRIKLVEKPILKLVERNEIVFNKKCYQLNDKFIRLTKRST